MEEERGSVCVTGGTGFIASWIIKRLLEAGYSVNTTVRSHPEQKRDVSFLTNLPRAANLQIFNADLCHPQSFNEAIEGCTGVFHVASPIDYFVTEPEEVVTKRSIDGALGILRACLKSGTVKRFVYTSGTDAATFSGKDDEVIDESFWSDVDFLRAEKPPYVWSGAVAKTLTEKAVLEFGEQNGLDVVTFLPSYVVGPFICPKLPDSVAAALALPFGHKDLYGTYFHTPVVHVDDVTRAYIFLLEHPNPRGRYCCSAGMVTIEKLHEILSTKYPEYQIPTLESLKDIEGYKSPAISSKKLIDAGFEFKYEIEEMFDDAIQCCKEKSYL